DRLPPPADAAVSDFTQLVDLAAERLGGRVLFANDEFFAGKEALLRAERPLSLPDKYTTRGKWMDGWETRRRRTPGHDWCLARRAAPGVRRALAADGCSFAATSPPHASLGAWRTEGPGAWTARAGPGLPRPGVPWLPPGKAGWENPFPLEEGRR